MRAKGKRKKYQRTLCDNLACKNKKAKNKNKKKTIYERTYTYTKNYSKTNKFLIFSVHEQEN